MPSNHNKAVSNDEAAVTMQVSGDESSINLDDYAATAELPIYQAPVVPSLTFPLLQYGKKVNVVSGRKPSAFTGFLVGIEQSAELDDLLEQQGVPQVRIRHRNGTEDSYWQFTSVHAYILCTAVPETYGPDAWKKSGMAYIWNEHVTTYNYGSQLQCIVFLRGLLTLGYTQPLVLTLSRTVTEHFIARVLRRQEAMIEAIKKALRKQGKPDELAFYAYSVELLKAAEEITIKNGGSYYPPATTIPNPLTVGYVLQQQTPLDHLAIIEAFLPVLPQWAAAASARLAEPPRDNGGATAAPAAEPEETTTAE